MEDTLEEPAVKDPIQDANNITEEVIPNGVNGEDHEVPNETSMEESIKEDESLTRLDEDKPKDKDDSVELMEVDEEDEEEEGEEEEEEEIHSNTSDVECIDEGGKRLMEDIDKTCEENGSCDSPDIEEITDDKCKNTFSPSSTPPTTKDSVPVKKKPRKQIDLSTITPRRSSRNIKRTSYIEKELEEEQEDNESDIEEIKQEDPLAGIDGKDKENTKLKSPIKNSCKNTIVVNDTKRLVEIAAGSKSMKGGKKEPTLVIIDTNSILSGRGGVPVTNNKPVTSNSSFSVLPVTMTPQTIYPNTRTTITPVPMTKLSISSSPKVNVPPAQATILPTLTDDMFVVEAPSFIVPYVYEKPPIKALKEFIVKLDKSIKEKEDEEEDEDEDDEDEDEEDEEDDRKVGENDKKDKVVNRLSDSKTIDDKHKSSSYFDLPLGKFFMQIGINLVQEHVQTDLLRTQKRKQGKGTTSAETQMAINSLIKNLEFSKENNEPFHLDMKKCEFCNFKTESALVMQHHLETPHMRNYVYKCNFCPIEVRSPHDILFHMEAEHNTRGRLERGPAFHQCPNCPFEDNQKGKLTRHILACSKKFRADRNLEPSVDWEPPAKIPRLHRPRPVSGPANNNAAAAAAAIAMAMNSKGTQPLLPKLLPAPVAGRGRGRPPMQPRYADLKSLRPGVSSSRADNVSGMMYRPTSSGLLVPAPYQFSSSQIFQNPSPGSKNPTAKLLSQPSISITPLPRTPSQSTIPGSGSCSKPGGKNTFVICEICDGYIKDLEQLRNHMQWIHKVKIHPKMIYNRPPLNCQKCQFRFFTDQGLERHLLGSHGLVTSSMQEAANKGKDAGRCPACGRVYQWKLLNHVARDHGMTLKPAHLSYKCTVCTATFGMYKQFENHVYSAHSVVAKRVMDTKKSNSGGSSSSSSTPSTISSRSNDSLLKPLKINDEITIIPQPAKPTTRSGGSQGRSK